MARNDDLIEKIERLKNMLVAHATGSSGDDGEYLRIRAELLREPSAKDRLPRFVRTCRSLSEFWRFIKPKFAHYAERREFLREEGVEDIRDVRRCFLEPDGKISVIRVEPNGNAGRKREVVGT